MNAAADTGKGPCPYYTVKEIFPTSKRMVRGFVEKNYNKEIHSQEFYEINIVLSGSANHYIGEQKMAVTKGDVFILPPDVMHGYDGSNGFDVYHVLLSPKFLEKHSASLQLLPAFSSLFRIDPLMRARASAQLYFRLSEEEITAFASRFDTLSTRSHENGSAAILVCEGEALALISELCDIYERRSGSSAAPSDGDAAFLASMAHLYEHYNERLTIETLAKIAQMSRSAYITKFKRVTGQTPARLIRQYRVEMIKQLLMDTSLTEEEIAHTTGCVDVSHLIKLFLSEMGTTPSKYRKRRP